jgi:flagellar basal body L-ring protein FlgH
MVSDPLISTDYWTDLQITQQDVEYLHNHLFELETPLTAGELVTVLIDERIRVERQVVQERRQSGGKTYLPIDISCAQLETWQSYKRT